MAMSWTEGKQKIRKNEWRDINKTILDTKGFLEEKEAKMLLYQFLRQNTTFAVDLMSGSEVIPLSAYGCEVYDGI